LDAKLGAKRPEPVGFDIALRVIGRHSLAVNRERLDRALRRRCNGGL